MRMKKTMCVLIAVLLMASLFAGCGKPTASQSDQSPGGVETQVPAVGKPTASQSDQSPGGIETQVPAVGSSTVAESYSAYLEAKNALLTKLTDGLSNNPDTVMATLSFFGITMVDVAALPVSYFGLGQQAAEIGLSMVGAANVKYTENGNSYTISYSDDENNTYVFSGTYDPAAGALTCTATANGKESIFFEYRKTAFGYAGQYYMLNDDDGTATAYVVTTDGENGTVGFTSASEKPAALTGSVAADFPKTSSEWYSIQGTTITGKTSDGKEISFEYTPSESESN
jgi:hypothetical protein